MEMNNIDELLHNALQANEKLMTESQRIVNEKMPKDEHMTPEMKAEIDKAKKRISDLKAEFDNLKY